MLVGVVRETDKYYVLERSLLWASVGFLLAFWAGPPHLSPSSMLDFSNSVPGPLLLISVTENPSG